MKGIMTVTRYSSNGLKVRRSGISLSGLMSTYEQEWFFLESLEENPVPCFFQLQEATYILGIWPYCSGLHFHGHILLSDSDPPDSLLEGLL